MSVPLVIQACSESRPKLAIIKPGSFVTKLRNKFAGAANQDSHCICGVFKPFNASYSRGSATRKYLFLPSCLIVTISLALSLVPRGTSWANPISNVSRMIRFPASFFILASIAARALRTTVSKKSVIGAPTCSTVPLASSAFF